MKKVKFSRRTFLKSGLTGIVVLFLWAILEIYRRMIRPIPSPLKSGNNIPTTSSLTPQPIYLPDDFLNNVSNPGAQISSYLSGSSQKIIVFPLNKTWTLEQQVKLIGMKNTTVDFNGCTLRMPDSCGFTPAYDRYALAVLNSSSCTLKGINLDGNRLGNVGNDEYGIVIGESANLAIQNSTFHDFTHHAIVIYKNTPLLEFDNTTVYDNFGMNTCADIYIENGTTDSVSFSNTKAYRKFGSGNQVFYVNGFNSSIDDVSAKDVRVVADYRRGKHSLKNVVTDHCQMVIIIQGASAELIASGIIGTNLETAHGLDSGLYIYACTSANLENIHLESLLSVKKPFGLRFNAGAHKVMGNNISIKNAYTACLEYDEVGESIYLSNIILARDFPQTLGYSIRVSHCTAHQYIKSLTATPTDMRISDPDKFLVVS